MTKIKTVADLISLFRGIDLSFKKPIIRKTLLVFLAFSVCLFFVMPYISAILLSQSITVRIKSERRMLMDFYYDTGKGLSEENNMAEWIAGSEDFQDIKLELPAKPITSFRVDLLNDPGTICIKSIILERPFNSSMVWTGDTLVKGVWALHNKEGFVPSNSCLVIKSKSDDYSSFALAEQISAVNVQFVFFAGLILAILICAMSVMARRLISETRFNDAKVFLAIGVIMIGALLMRSYHITGPINDSHSFRQAQTAGLIRDFYRQGVDLFYPTMITLGDPGYVILEFPLYQAISALLYKLLLPDVIVARLFSILCGLLSIVFIYRLTNRFLDRTSAFFASFFYAFMPLNIFFQRVPMPDPLAILLSLSMLDFLIEGVNKRKTFLLIAGMVAGSLGLMIKSPYVAPLYLPLICAVFKQKKNLRVFLNARFLLSLFIPFAVLALWQRHANAVNETYFSVSGYPFRELYHVVIVKLKPLNEWYFGTIAQRLDFGNYMIILERIFKEMLSFVGIAVLIFGGVSVVKNKVATFYVLWLSSILLSMMVIFNLNVVHNYYQLPLSPIIAIFCGAGCAYLVGVCRNRIVAISTGVVLTLSFIVLGCSVSQKLFRPENDLMAVGQFVDNGIEKDVMIATSLPKIPDQDLWYPTLMYYSDRHGFNVPHRRLDAGMISYLMANNIKYLVVVDYARGNDTLNKALSHYRIKRRSERVTVYDITSYDKGGGKEK
jgi:hypothetical protein